MRTALLAFLLLLAGCATDATEVMLVVQGEFDVPSEVDELAIVVTAPNGNEETVNVPLTAEAGFPRILGIVRGEGGSGVYVVAITAKRGGATVLLRRARFQFRNDEVRMLQVTLRESCVGVSCPGSERTCGEMGTCDRDRLETDPWEGAPGPLVDAGP